MSAQTRQLTNDARDIWQAGVDAVHSERLVNKAIHCADNELIVCKHRLALSDLDQIVVVGAGKAGAGMAAAVEQALGQPVVEGKVAGWVNVPADCLRSLSKIHLHAGRPAGVNEPVEAGVIGSEEILRLVSQLGPNDLCLVLISGGGSALLPAPCQPLTLADKQTTTRFLMNHGANILELNTVRKRLSRIKGGGLARACTAGKMITLIISDIVADPLDMIASGPTVPDPTSNRQALEVLYKFKAASPDVPQAVFDFLESGGRDPAETAFPESVSNHIIGNNQTALDAAAEEARRRGYQVFSMGSDNTGEANSEGIGLANSCRSLREGNESKLPICILSGGEPVVQLAKTDKPRRGGRNQQLVLAGLQQLQNDGLDRMVLLSGGTDGEDGPTDAAGAWVNADILAKVKRQDADISTWLDINDSWSFFERFGGLLKTGPTHTNVMDLRVALVGAKEAGPR